MIRFKDILVPIDFSEHSGAALETATEITKRFGAKVWLLHCCPVHSGGISACGIVIPARYHRDIRNEAEHRLRQSQDKVEAEGDTLNGIIGSLDSQHPGFRERVCDESGEIRNFVNIYVNGEDVRFLNGLGTPTKTGDEISIVPAVAVG